MLDPVERQSIIDEAVEKAREHFLLLLPETIGNLMASRSVLLDLNKKFYAKYQEFKGKESVVQSIVEMVEGKNPLKKYEEILELAVPEIRNRIKTQSTMNIQDVVKKPDRDFKGVLNA